MALWKDTKPISFTIVTSGKGQTLCLLCVTGGFFMPKIYEIRGQFLWTQKMKNRKFTKNKNCDILIMKGEENE